MCSLRATMLPLLTMMDAREGSYCLVSGCGCFPLSVAGSVSSPSLFLLDFPFLQNLQQVFYDRVRSQRRLVDMDEVRTFLPLVISFVRFSTNLTRGAQPPFTGLHVA